MNKLSTRKTSKRRGRPPGSKNRKTILREVAQQTYVVMEQGKKIRRSTLDLILLRLRNLALDGKNKQAVAEFHKWLEKSDPQSPNQGLGVLVAPAEMTPEEWIFAAERANDIMTKHGIQNLAQVNKFIRNQK